MIGYFSARIRVYFLMQMGTRCPVNGHSKSYKILIYMRLSEHKFLKVPKGIKHICCTIFFDLSFITPEATSRTRDTTIQSITYNIFLAMFLKT